MDPMLLRWWRALTRAVRRAIQDSSLKTAGDDPTRLKGDREVVDRLREAGFAGPPLVVFYKALFEYAFHLLQVQIVSGRIFGRLLFILPEWNGPIPDDLAEDMALETLSVAIPRFTEKELRTGKWDPELGASLATYFIGYCDTYEFPNVYRRYYRRYGRLAAQPDGDPDQRPGGGCPADDTDRWGRDEHLRAFIRTLPKNTKLVLLLRWAGYSNREIAAKLNRQEDWVQSQVRHARDKFTQWRNR